MTNLKRAFELTEKARKINESYKVELIAISEDKLTSEVNALSKRLEKIDKYNKVAATAIDQAKTEITHGSSDSESLAKLANKAIKELQDQKSAVKDIPDAAAAIQKVIERYARLERMSYEHKNIFDKWDFNIKL